MSRAEQPAPPRGGLAPPSSLPLPDGTMVFLAPLAHDAADRHLSEFPDETDRYGPAGHEWCAHDLHWIIGWAFLDAGGERHLLRTQVTWLVGVLAARGYPVERMSRSLEICAEVVARDVRGADAVAERLRAAAAAL